MLLSAGVTTGWHLAQVAQQAFGDEICYLLCIPGKGLPAVFLAKIAQLLVAFRAFTMPYMVICKHSKTLPA